MSVSSTTNKVTYTGTGTTGPFDFDFPVYVSSDIVVDKYTIATGATTTLTETTDYSVTIDGDNTGSVTTVAAVTSAYRLVIRRVLPLTQEIDYVEGDKFPAATHEEGLDRARMVDQQLQEQIDRSVKIGVGTSVTEITLPTPVDGKALLWDGVTGALKNSTVEIEDVATAVTAAEAAQTAAEAAQTAAELAETNAETAETNAEASAVAAAAFAYTRGTFTDASLATGVLTITHNGALSAPYSMFVEIFDNNGKKIHPDEITGAANSVAIDLTSYGTLSGTWGYGYKV